MRHIGLIPRNRLDRLPMQVRSAHEYCFFLHDQCVAILKEYEAAEAHILTIKFPNKRISKKFQQIANAEDSVSAMRKLGYEEEAKKVLLNTITMAMASDCLHHLYEGLRCLEKRKFIVALNILRKPLKDNLIYIAWMLGDRDGFYHEFSAGDSKRLAPDRTGSKRAEILARAIKKTRLTNILDSKNLETDLFDRKNPHGLEVLFQHAVHLITVSYEETHTHPENFNFIFKHPLDDDLYDNIYSILPDALLFLAHLLIELFNEIQPMELGAYDTFYVRSILGHSLTAGDGSFAQDIMDNFLKNELQCPTCEKVLKITKYNTARIALTDSFRCTHCQRLSDFPFSWLL